MMQKAGALLTAVSVIAASAAVGGSYGPTPNRPATALWYFLLRKPGFTPPGPAIGAAWGILDTMLVVSGYRLLAEPPSEHRRAALAGWGLSAIAVAAHPFLFFGRRSTTGGLAASVSLIASSATAVIAATRVDRLAAICGAPLVVWSIFAGVLSEELVREN